MAKKYGIPYIDLNGDERTPAMIRAQNSDIPSAVKTIIQNAKITPHQFYTETFYHKPFKKASEFFIFFIFLLFLPPCAFFTRAR